MASHDVKNKLRLLTFAFGKIDPNGLKRAAKSLSLYGITDDTPKGLNDNFPRLY